MDISSGLTFPQDLFLDRRRGKYCFQNDPDQIRINPNGVPITLRELRLLFHPYVAVKILRDEEMFDAEALEYLSSQQASPRMASGPQEQKPARIRIPLAPAPPSSGPSRPETIPASTVIQDKVRPEALPDPPPPDPKPDRAEGPSSCTGQELSSSG